MNLQTSSNPRKHSPMSSENLQPAVNRQPGFRRGACRAVQMFIELDQTPLRSTQSPKLSFFSFHKVFSERDNSVEKTPEWGPERLKSLSGTPECLQNCS